MEKVGGSTDEGSGGLWLEKHGQSQVRGALGLGWLPCPPAGGSPGLALRALSGELVGGRARLRLLLVAGRV